MTSEKNSLMIKCSQSLYNEVFMQGDGHTDILQKTYKLLSTSILLALRLLQYLHERLRLQLLT